MIVAHNPSPATEPAALVTFRTTDQARRVVNLWKRYTLTDHQEMRARAEPPPGWAVAWVVRPPRGGYFAPEPRQYMLGHKAPHDGGPEPPRELTTREWGALSLALRGVEVPSDFEWAQSDYYCDDSDGRWAWDRLVPREGVALLAGPPKGGKSTLLRSYLEAFAAGRPFLGRRTGWRAGLGAVVLSEEPRRAWAKWSEAPPGVAIWDMSSRRVAKLVDWSRLLEQVNQFARALDVDLLVIDTLTNIVTVSENDPRQLALAVKPLRSYAEYGMAVVIVHHTNKGMDSAPGLNSRGSGALPGLVDSVIELDRVSDDPLDARRRLTVVGRLAPAQVIDYRMDAAGELVAGESKPANARRGARFDGGRG